MSLPESSKFDPASFSGVARLFPLPNLMMFPHVLQPLHIFEPAYLHHARSGAGRRPAHRDGRTRAWLGKGLRRASAGSSHGLPGAHRDACGDSRRPT